MTNRKLDHKPKLAMIRISFNYIYCKRNAVVTAVVPDVWHSLVYIYIINHQSIIYIIDVFV